MLYCIRNNSFKLKEHSAELSGQGKHEEDLKNLPVEVIPILFRKKSCRSSLALLVGSSFQVKPI